MQLKIIQRSLEYVLAAIFSLLAIAALIGSGWRFTTGFGVLAISLGLSNDAWKTMSCGRILRFLTLTLATLSVSI